MPLRAARRAASGVLTVPYPLLLLPSGVALDRLVPRTRGARERKAHAGELRGRHRAPFVVVIGAARRCSARARRASPGWRRGRLALGSKRIGPLDPRRFAMLASILRRSLFLAFVSTPALVVAQGNVHVVGPGGFNQIQDAVNAAQDGDTILVRSTAFLNPVDIDGKALTIAGDLPFG